MSTFVKCHVTDHKIQVMDGAFVAKNDGSWYFVSVEQAGSISDYGFPCERVFRTPEATISWISHLATKPWFNSEKFTAFMHELAHKNGFTQSF